MSLLLNTFTKCFFMNFAKNGPSKLNAHSAHTEQLLLYTRQPQKISKFPSFLKFFCLDHTIQNLDPHLFATKFQPQVPLLDLQGLVFVQMFYHLDKNMCHWSKMSAHRTLESFFSHYKRLGRSVANKIPCLQVGLKAYLFLLNTFLTILAVTLFS